MIDILIVISIAISAFIATNIDDLFILTILFAHPRYDNPSVIIGQYAGMISLILISIPIYIFKSSIPDFFMIIMGFIPLLIGLNEIIAVYNNKTKSLQIPSENKNKNKNENENSSSDPNESNYSGNLESDNILDKEIDHETFLKYEQINSRKYQRLAWISVALITISNGADNIGVYALYFLH